MKRRTTILLIIGLLPAVAWGQKEPVATVKSDSSDLLLDVILPPIEILFENAKNGPSWEFYNLKKDELNRKYITEKRSWYQFVDLFGTYQYGVVGMNSYTDLGTNYPIIYQNSGGEQLWYNAGVSVRFPLDKVIDRKNRIKTQKSVVGQAEKEQEMWFEDRKMKIIDQYTKSEEMINNLKTAIEQYSLSQAEYDMAEKDYIMGTITISELGIAKGKQVQAVQQLAKIRSELKNSILQLEILSCTKILNK